jgi:Ca2+-binding EF-hand superfamily protein
VKLQLTLSLAALACGAAYAQDQAPAAPAQDPSTASIFMQMDTDKDGKLNADEAKASTVVSSGFSKADADGDGKISRDEFTSTFTARAPSAPPPALPTPAPGE